MHSKFRVDLYNSESNEDAEADYFALCLLIPKHTLKKILTVTKDIAVIARYFGVDPSLVKLRLQTLSKL